MVASGAPMNTALKAAGSKSPLDLGRAISAVGEHIIAVVARVQQPIQLLAVVHGRIGHRIMPDQLVLGVRVHMVLVAEEAGRSSRTASRPARPWPASRGTAKASWNPECCPRSRAPESARTTAGRAPDIPPARPTDC